MPICFWKLCHCPDGTPCVEHDGAECSQLNGVNITKESDVSDALTGAIAVAIATLEGEKAAAEKARKQMEDKRTEIEKDLSDLQNLIDNATDRAGRRAVRDKYEELYKKYTNTITDLGDALDRYQRIVQYPIGQIGRTQPSLIIPYSDPAGYCACYQEKLKRLAAVAGALAAEQANFANLAASLNTYRQTVRNYYKYATTLAVVAGGTLAWFLYIYLGITFWGWQTLLILIAVAAVLAGMIAYVLYMEHLIAASQILILKLMLEYYELQSIPTCKKTGSSASSGGTGWWEDLMEMINKALTPPPETVPDPH
jgi:hypothetical protein